MHLKIKARDNKIAIESTLPALVALRSLSLAALEIIISKCSNLPPLPTLQAPFSRRMQFKWWFEALAAMAAACLLLRRQHAAQLLT